MKKKLLFLAASLLFIGAASAQQRKCAAHEIHEQKLANDPVYAAKQAQLEEHTANFVRNYEGNRVSGSQIIIPCIVQVVYANAQENISDAQIQSQIDRLNKDYGATNSDYNSVPSTFTNVRSGDTNIRFELIEIKRFSNSRNEWGTNDLVKSTYPPIEPARILNMWVADIGGGILGYAQFPNDTPATDGVVMSPQYFGDASVSGGSSFYLSAPFNLGRTATHEVGHWLNLRHIWGDGNCSQDDFVSDTPVAGNPNYGCPSAGTNSCSGGLSDMFMNYMDYVDDACMFMFSAGQDARIQATFSNGGGREGFLLDPVYNPGGGTGGGGACAATVTSFPYSESFESNTGAWSQGTGDDLDWTRDSAGTPSSSTGPSNGSAGSFYMYVEASSPNYPSKRTYLDGPCFDLSGESVATFEFDYHMYGSSMGTLALEAKPDGGSWASVWSRSGDQGNAWASASVDLGSYVGNSVQLRFNGLTGNNFRSDMAIDNLSLTTAAPATCDVPTGLSSSSVGETTFTLNWTAVSGAVSYDIDVNGTVLNSTTNSISLTGASAATTYTCAVRTNCASLSSAYSSSINVTTQAASGGGGNGCTGGIASFPYSESFESGLGAWSQGSGDDNNWTRDSGGTPSSGTGPSSGSAGSWYMYLETSGNGNGFPNKTAYLNSPCFNLSGESAATFAFDYHMNGTSMGSLVLQVSDDNGASWSSAWSISGSQGNAWQTATVDFGAYVGGSVQARFLATSGTSWSSDIAVDDISLSTSGSGGGGGSSTSTVVLTLVTDNYGSETSWSLTDGAGTTLGSGSGYGNNQTITETFTLAAGCYNFTINDQYGDGICCSYGNGSYTLSEGSTTLTSGGSFGSTETKNFCVGGSARQAATTVATTEKVFNSAVSLFPNPATEKASVRLSIDKPTSVGITVSDMQGKAVRTVAIKSAIGSFDQPLDLVDLRPGLYIVNVSTGAGFNKTMKLVVN